MISNVLVTEWKLGQAGSRQDHSYKWRSGRMFKDLIQIHFSLACFLIDVAIVVYYTNE